MRESPVKSRKHGRYVPIFRVTPVRGNSNILKGEIGKYISNGRSNIGVPKGTPISAQLFIIYADHIMNI